MLYDEEKDQWTASHCGRTQKTQDLLIAYYVPCPAGHHPPRGHMNYGNELEPH